MTAAKHNSSMNPNETIRFNPFLLLLLLLVAPYLLFLVLLILVTGEFNVALLFQAVWQGEWSAYLKTWVIGSFILWLMGTLFVSGLRTERFIARLFTPHTVAPPRPPRRTHYVIETVPESVPETPAVLTAPEPEPETQTEPEAKPATEMKHDTEPPKA